MSSEETEKRRSDAPVAIGAAIGMVLAMAIAQIIDVPVMAAVAFGLPLGAAIGLLLVRRGSTAPSSEDTE